MRILYAEEYQNTVTRFPRFLGKFSCISKWLKPGIFSARLWTPSMRLGRNRHDCVNTKFLIVDTNLDWNFLEIHASHYIDASKHCWNSRISYQVFTNVNVIKFQLFNCQIVVKRQQIKNHSNLGISGWWFIHYSSNTYNWLLLVTLCTEKFGWFKKQPQCLGISEQ